MILDAQFKHSLHHINAKGLQTRYSLSKEQAHHIVLECDTCQQFASVPFQKGVNPRGTQPNELWQMDVSIVPSFGKLQHVHHCAYTFSHVQCPTPLATEKADAINHHLLACFAVMGVPSSIKVDNAPPYASKKLVSFFEIYPFGIPFNSQGQDIVEHANRTLKLQLQKLKGGDYGTSPREQLYKLLYTFNF